MPNDSTLSNPQQTRPNLARTLSPHGLSAASLLRANALSREPPQTRHRLNPKGAARSVPSHTSCIQFSVDGGAGGSALLGVDPDHTSLDRGRRAARLPLRLPRARLRRGSRRLSGGAPRAMSRDPPVHNCPLLTRTCSLSGELPPCKHSSFSMVVCPNVTPCPLLSSRDLLSPSRNLPKAIP